MTKNTTITRSYKLPYEVGTLVRYFVETEQHHIGVVLDYRNSDQTYLVKWFTHRWDLSSDRIGRHISVVLKPLD
jgi:hypothetical protein